MANIINYFSLWTTVPELGGSSGQSHVRQPLILLGVLLGALAKVVYDWLTSQAASLSWQPFAVAAIAGLVAFPYLYEKAGLNRGRLTLAKWLLAFQNGFFWSVAMDAISKLHGHG
ncbi:hypothetical protein QWJ07_00160 [Frankia sp. RB7]|nr:hypothetical protein [Frankia sp. RB7]